MTERAAPDQSPDLPSEPRVVRHAEADPVSLSPTNHFRVLFGGHVGAPELFTEEAGKGDGPPLHRHPWASWEVVVEGRVHFQIDGQGYDLGPGDAIYTPPMAAHAYRVESDTARTIGLNYPARHFFDLQRKAAPLFADGPPDMQTIARLAADHDVELLGPPL